MKKSVLFLGLIALIMAVGSVRTFAYYHDDRGWYDGSHHRHPYIYYHHHRGYWDQRNGARIFINI